MVKKYFSKDIERIASGKLESMVGKIKIKKEQDAYEELSGRGLKKYMKDVVRGGKTLTSIERKLKTSGVVLNQAGKRQKLMKMVGGGKSSASTTKKMQRAENRRKASLARQAQVTAELIEGRKDPLHKVFGGQKTETSEHIGVARPSGAASALNDISDEQNRASALSVNVSPSGIKAHDGQHGVQADDSPVPVRQDTNDLSGKPPSTQGAPDSGNLTPGIGAVSPQLPGAGGGNGGPKPISSANFGMKFSQSAAPLTNNSASAPRGGTGVRPNNFNSRLPGPPDKLGGNRFDNAALRKSPIKKP